MNDNSYDDIDWLNRANAHTRKEIERLNVKQRNASSWLGKWYWQVQIDKLKKKLYHFK